MNHYCRLSTVGLAQLNLPYTWRSLVLCTILLCTSDIYLGGVVKNANAEDGENIAIPADAKGKLTYSKKSGLQVVVDTVWGGNRGYRPVTVTVKTAKPAAADTLLTIDFHAGHWRNKHRSISIEQDFELLQGATQAKVTFSVPQYEDWSTYGWTLWVDGVRDEELSPPIRGFNTRNSGRLTVGVLEAEPQVLSVMKMLSGNSFDMVSLDASKLPIPWTGYSSLDVIQTTIQSLEFVRTNSPRGYRELLRWVGAGGSVWVLDVGKDFKQLPKLESLLSKENISPDINAMQLDSWRFLKLGVREQNELGDLVTLTLQESEELTLTSEEILDSRDPDLALDSRQWFIARAFGLGRVVAFQASSRVVNENNNDWIALQRAAVENNLNWVTRHGNDPAGGNSEFNDWLIPDVGTAPVLEFQLLISLFVISIGPVNYWLLKRRNQLPLLLVTVPAAALAATVLLFAYGFLGDGVGSRVRVRSMTLLDQELGEIASWARLSYYAGIAPAEGLKMPLDTTIYPILPARSGGNRFADRSFAQQRSVAWDKQQHLARGWMASRTPTQYLALTARSTKKHLEFDEQSDQLSVTNHLETQILALAVQDHEGNFFVGEVVDGGDTVKLKPSNYVEAAAKLRQFLTLNLPQSPVPFDSRNRNYNTRISDGLLERHLNSIAVPTVKGWGNGVYIAVTATGIEVPLGLEEVTETNSFHVIRGSW